MQKKRMIYNYGSINIDNVYRVPHLVKPGETLASSHFHQVLGGKGSNQSLAIARAGNQVCHLGAIASSDAWIADLLKGAGVEISRLALLDDTASGHTVIQVDDQAENCIVLFPGANHRIPAEVVTDALEEASPHDWLLLQNECGDLSKVLAKAFDKGLKVALNPAPMEAAIANLPLERLALLIVNQGEAEALLTALGDTLGKPEPHTLMDELSSHFPDQEILLTLGGAGAIYRSGNNTIEQPVFKVNARDTTGAGDTFVGYFLAARANNEEAAQALLQASAAAALCVQADGASSSIPAYTEVMDFLSHHSTT